MAASFCSLISQLLATQGFVPHSWRRSGRTGTMRAVGQGRPSSGDRFSGCQTSCGLCFFCSSASIFCIVKGWHFLWFTSSLLWSAVLTTWGERIISLAMPAPGSISGCFPWPTVELVDSALFFGVGAGGSAFFPAAVSSG